MPYNTLAISIRICRHDANVILILAATTPHLLTGLVGVRHCSMASECLSELLVGIQKCQSCFMLLSSFCTWTDLYLNINITWTCKYFTIGHLKVTYNQLLIYSRTKQWHTNLAPINWVSDSGFNSPELCQHVFSLVLAAFETLLCCVISPAPQAKPLSTTYTLQ